MSGKGSSSGMSYGGGPRRYGGNERRCTGGRARRGGVEQGCVAAVQAGEPVAEQGGVIVVQPVVVVVQAGGPVQSKEEWWWCKEVQRQCKQVGRRRSKRVRHGKAE